MQDLLLDVRYALRGFRKSPAFTLVVVLSLALAIGANGFVFGVLNAVVLRPLEVSDPQSLYQIRNGPRMSGRMLTTSYPAFQDLRQRNATFSDMIGIYSYSEAELGWREAVLKVRGLEVTGNYFDLLGVQPQIGRFFHAVDERGPDSAPYLVLSDALWRGAFNADRGVVGKTVRLNEHPVTVIGVAAARFHGTERFCGRTTSYPSSTRSGGRIRCRSRTERAVMVIGRLKPGVTPQQATDDLNAITAQLATEYPKTDKAVIGATHPSGPLWRRRRGHSPVSLQRERAGAPAAGGGLREPGERLCGARGGSQPGAGASRRSRLEPAAAGQATADGGAGDLVHRRRGRLDERALAAGRAEPVAGILGLRQPAPGPGTWIRACTWRVWR